MIESRDVSLDEVPCHAVHSESLLHAVSYSPRRFSDHQDELPAGAVEAIYEPDDHQEARSISLEDSALAASASGKDVAATECSGNLCAKDVSTCDDQQQVETLITTSPKCVTEAKVEIKKWREHAAQVCCSQQRRLTPTLSRVDSIHLNMHTNYCCGL
jgi:hypothetical protein